MPNEKGNWILINKRINNGNREISFKYDTIPDDAPETNKLEEGVYHYNDIVLKKIGELDEFNSLHELSYEGFYFLSPPGIFYNKKLLINDIK